MSLNRPRVDTSRPAYDQQPQPQPHPHPQPPPPPQQRTEQSLDQNLPHPQPPSPRAPAYSPITPKVQPVFPVPSSTQRAFIPPDNGGTFTFHVPDAQTPQPAKDKPVIPPTEYIPQPPNLPFSSDDATDAIALRAAISTLQFQKKKAQQDLRTLQSLKELALADPNYFKAELKAGRAVEKRPTLGDISAILDVESDGEDEDEDSDDEAPAGDAPSKNGVSGHAAENGSLSPHLPAEIPDSQPSQAQPPKGAPDKMAVDTSKPFPPVPGAQSVVRMPYINWEKYGIAGEPLDRMHAQQQKWPGTSSTSLNKGREYTVHATYSPFHDTLEPKQKVEGEHRKDSGATSTTPVVGTLTSDHPMETRKR